MPASSSTALFIEPLDVLILRGNKLFADAGSHGEALMPPWPSVAAGALRSRMLIDACKFFHRPVHRTARRPDPARQ